MTPKQKRTQIEEAGNACLLAVLGAAALVAVALLCGGCESQVKIETHPDGTYTATYTRTGFDLKLDGLKVRKKGEDFTAEVDTANAEYKGYEVIDKALDVIREAKP